jgi:hypothetical protein
MQCSAEFIVYKYPTTVAALATWIVAAAPALAASITNRDDRPHQVTIIEGERKTEQSLAPAGVLEGVCSTGCVLRLNESDDDEYQLEGNEIVSIEDGFLYYDGPDAPAETPPSGEPPGAGQPKR